MKKEEIQMLSFQIISGAGDALDCFGRAVDEAKKGNYDKVEQEFAKGEEMLSQCHNLQTDLLRCECNDDDIPFSVLLIHAQDHLMTTGNYERITREFVELYKTLNHILGLNSE